MGLGEGLAIALLRADLLFLVPGAHVAASVSFSGFRVDHTEPSAVVGLRVRWRFSWPWRVMFWQMWFLRNWTLMTAVAGQPCVTLGKKVPVGIRAVGCRLGPASVR